MFLNNGDVSPAWKLLKEIDTLPNHNQTNKQANKQTDKQNKTKQNQTKPNSKQSKLLLSSRCSILKKSIMPWNIKLISILNGGKSLSLGSSSQSSCWVLRPKLLQPGCTGGWRLKKNPSVVRLGHERSLDH